MKKTIIDKANTALEHNDGIFSICTKVAIWIKYFAVFTFKA